MSLDVLCLRPAADFERVDARAPASLQVVYRFPDDADVPALMKQALALVIPAVGQKLANSLFDSTTVRLVQITGAGLDRVDLDLLKKLGIAVANVPGGSNDALAEYVVASASLLLRQMAWASAEIKSGNYSAFRSRMLASNLAGLDGLPVGVVGLGTIGMSVAQALHSRGCRIAFYDPAPRDPAAAAAIGAQSSSLDALLQNSDVVTLHVPLLPATQGLIGARELGMMKRGAILIHASRGGIVDERALASSLESGHLGGAAVDVYSQEPPERENPLLSLVREASHRLLLTPHIAGVTRQSANFLFRSAWQNVVRVVNAGQPPQNCCN
ncbi:MAG: NAD(P)-dependent oxidoreductase [Candidatus Acidiferrales bacterium]